MTHTITMQAYAVTMLINTTEANSTINETDVIGAVPAITTKCKTECRRWVLCLLSVSLVNFTIHHV